MQKEERQRIAQENAATMALANQCLVIRFLSMTNSVVRDPKKFNLDAQERGVEITHLSLDGAGGGIFSIPWENNKEFLKAFLRSQKEFISNQHYRYSYQISPPPAIAELLVSCDYVRPVFDVDLWDEGVYDTSSEEYFHLKKRIMHQIMMLFTIFKRLFPSNVDQPPEFTDEGSLFTMPDTIAWKKLDMAILESPCKPVTKDIFGRGKVDGIKHSFHLRFPFVRVKKVLMYGINAYLTNRLDTECPRMDGNSSSIRLANTWCEALDAKIIQTGIKLPGSQKATKCPECLAILEHERNEDKLAKARRQIAQSSITPTLKNRARAGQEAKQPATFEDDKLNLNNPYVQALNKEDLQQIILSLSATYSSSTTGPSRYGPSRCGQFRCANMRQYDGRFHSCIGLVDAQATPDLVLAARTLLDLVDPVKSEEFARNEVRQLWMLQARTQFRSSNLTLDDSISLSDYSNMYDPSVRSDISKFIKKSQPSRTVAPVGAPVSSIVDLTTPMTDRDLFVNIMSQSAITLQQREAALKMVKSFDAHYAQMEISRLYWYENGLVLVPLGNESGRYCLNKLACHTSSTVRFILRLNHLDVPIAIPQCFCAKDVAFPAHNKTCRAFYKERYNELSKRIPYDLAQKIFAPFYESKRLREGPSAVVESPVQPAAQESIADIIVRTSSSRQRRVSVRGKLITEKESKRMDSSMRAQRLFTIDERSIPTQSEMSPSHTLQHMLFECQTSRQECHDRAETPANGFGESQEPDEFEQFLSMQRQ